VLASRIAKLEQAFAAHRTAVPWEELAVAYSSKVDGSMADADGARLKVWVDWQRQQWGEEVDTTLIKVPKRLTEMRLGASQLGLWRSTARINIAAAGRRSGKTELAKRWGVKRACRYARGTRGRVVFCAPTHQQAKRIFWEDIKALVPADFRAGKPSESELTIRLKNGVDIVVMGMDEPARIEGPPLLGVVCDEYANMRAEAWDHHIRPALTDTQGWAWLIGVPEGRNHYYDLAMKARTDETGEMAFFTWTTADVLSLYLPPEVAERELVSAKASMDPMTYDQEFNASFLNFIGAAYYNFNFDDHTAHNLPYNPDGILKFCFDFNMAPGVAVVAQEASKRLTHVIGEVHIPQGSNTPMVCERLIKDWGNHKGPVHCYGDATGGAGGSAKVEGSDKALLERALRQHFGRQVVDKFPKENPRERVRVNSVNSWLKDSTGAIHTLIDRAKCPMLIKDFEGVRVVKGGSGELDKNSDKALTHLTDAWGYKVHVDNPLITTTNTFRQVA